MENDRKRDTAAELCHLRGVHEKNMVVTTLEVQNEDAKIATVEHHARASSKVNQNMASDAERSRWNLGPLPHRVDTPRMRTTLLFGAKKSPQFRTISLHIAEGLDLQCQ